jgi:hypothetical protein
MDSDLDVAVLLKETRSFEAIREIDIPFFPWALRVTQLVTAPCSSRHAPSLIFSTSVSLRTLRTLREITKQRGKDEKISHVSFATRGSFPRFPPLPRHSGVPHPALPMQRFL